MARMLIMCQRPFHLSREEAEAWIRREASALLEDEAIGRVTFAVLESASVRWPRQCDWLLELELAVDAEPQEMVGRFACRRLLGDLRLLGMRPVLAVVREDVDLRAAS